MVLIDVGSRVMFSVARLVDRRLAEGSIANARVAVEANERGARWLYPDAPQTASLADAPRSA